jgi:hypothetical protein
MAATAGSDRAAAGPMHPGRTGSASRRARPKPSPRGEPAIAATPAIHQGMITPVSVTSPYSESCVHVMGSNGSWLGSFV